MEVLGSHNSVLWPATICLTLLISSGNTQETFEDVQCYLTITVIIHCMIIRSLNKCLWPRLQTEYLWLTWKASVSIQGSVRATLAFLSAPQQLLGDTVQSIPGSYITSTHQVFSVCWTESTLLKSVCCLRQVCLYES